MAYDPYSSGMRGLQAGLDYINAGKDRRQEQSQFKQGLEFDREKLAQQGAQFDKNYDLAIATLASSDAQWRGSQENTRTTADQLHERGVEANRIDSYRSETERSIADASNRSTDAATDAQIEATTREKLGRRGEANAAWVEAMDAEVLADFGGDVNSWATSPTGAARLTSLYNSDPQLLKNLSANHPNLKNPRMTQDGAGNFVIVGESGVTGQTATATARGETQGEGSTDGTLAFTSEELLAVVTNSASAYGGYKSTAAYRLLAPTPEAQAEVADLDTQLDNARTATKDVPKQKAPTGLGTVLAMGPTSQMVDAPQAPAPAPAPVEAPRVEDNPAYRNMVASAALGFTPDSTARAGQTGVVGPGLQAEHDKDLAANRSIAEAEATYRRENPNADLAAEVERNKMISGEQQRAADAGIAQVINGLDLSEIGFKDGFYETWRTESGEVNAQYAQREISATILSPDNKAQFEAEFGPIAEWNSKTWTDAATVVALARRDDHQASTGLEVLTLGAAGALTDRDSRGTVEGGFEKFRKGERIGNKGDKRRGLFQ